ncbi:protein kinase [Sorangium sp. So ce134]
MEGRLEQGAVVADRFVIERPVAQGGMGIIYRAFDRARDRPVALKLISGPPDAVTDARRFASEAQSLARLDHPRVVQYVGQGATPDGRPFLAMQWLDGEDLKSVLARGRLGFEDALRVVQGAAEALAAIHAVGLIHRDLKPSNLFLRDGSSADVVLLDFGIARRVDASQRLTAEGTLLGTPCYMAPEQASGDAELKPATDVFALGCIFYECLTGTVPFDAPQVFGVLARILLDDPQPVRRIRPSVPEPWAALLGRMLCKDPAGRPKDGAAVVHSLGELPPAEGRDETGPLCVDAPQEEESEQVLVCVVLARSPRAVATYAGDTVPARRSTWLSWFSEARSALFRFGFAVEELVDGSVIATVSGGGAATDQARIAARGALCLRELCPEAWIAVATGRAPLRGTARVGEAADRAARLLERADGTGLPRKDTDGIWLDSVTAGLLDARFVTSSLDGDVILHGERHDVDPQRLLLGKPTPCVGREIELGHLEGLVSRAIDDSAAQAAIVCAPPGAGKSRLRHELLHRVRTEHAEAEILIGYGDPLTAGSPYSVVSDALRRHIGLRDGDEPAAARGALADRLCRHVEPQNRRRVSEFLGELCGLPFPSEDSAPLCAARADPRIMREQITHAFLVWLAAECAAHPVLLVLEDLQWADVLTFDLLAIGLRERERAPLIVLALGRPEIEAMIPRFLSERAQALALRPLSRKASERLVKEVLGSTIEPELVARIVRLSEGNALFLEELIRAAAEGKANDVPETVLAMLHARLSRLAPEARRALRAAGIFGETFWCGGVRRICEGWAATNDTDRWVERLVKEELVERRWQSRFSAETELVFRHALVRDAAYGLLTDVERRTGHRYAGRWLEAMGETDAMVLAGHAQGSGDRVRAVAFYTTAAERSLECNDAAAAASRAETGLACGAAGKARGELLGILTLALYTQAKWPQSMIAGVEALDLLPRGSIYWCRIAEKLVHLFAGNNELERCEEMFRELLTTEPAPEARAAYLCALSMLLFVCAALGKRAWVNDCAAAMARVEGQLVEVDLRVLATTSLWRGYVVLIMDPDPYRAFSLLDQSVRAFTQIESQHDRSLALVLLGKSQMALGDYEGAEASIRAGVAIAERIRDDYQQLNARLYLGLLLAERADLASLDEAELLAQQVFDAKLSEAYETSAWHMFTQVALARGQWSRAERAGRHSIEQARTPPLYTTMYSVPWIRALTRLGHIEEASLVASEHLRSREQFGGLGMHDVPLLVAVAEAMLMAGDEEDGKRVLGEALRQIELRASRIPDAAMRERYLHGSMDNVGAFELARARGLQRQSMLG